MKRPLTVLLIEDEQEICQRFKDEIDEFEDIILVGITNNSYQALELVEEHTPDAVILDLELHYGQGNGLLFLQALKNLPLSIFPYLLITTNNSSSTTYRFARESGADFIMYKHEEDYSESKVIDFLRMMTTIIHSNQKQNNPLDTTSETPSKKKQRLKHIIHRELDLIGINPKSVGYQYLTDAILIATENFQPNIAALIAPRYNKTPASIERGMQNAINRAWCTTNIDDLLRHYTAKINSSKGVPTLTEFICYYSNKVKV